MKLTHFYKNVYSLIYTHFICRKLSNKRGHAVGIPRSGTLHSFSSTSCKCTGLVCFPNSLKWVKWFTGATVAPQKYFEPYRARQTVLEKGFSALRCCELKLASISMDLAPWVRQFSPLVCRSTIPARAGTELNTHALHRATVPKSGYSPPSLSKSLKNQQPRSHESA